MDDFIKDLIEYIKSGLNKDSGFPAKIKVVRAYSKNTEIESPQVSLYVLSDDDYARSSTFECETATVYPVQFYCYWKDGVKYNGNAYGAQLGAELLGEKISDLFEDKTTAINYNNNIKIIQKIGGAPFGMPVSNGSANYQSVPRFVFTVKKPYTAINKNK